MGGVFWKKGELNGTIENYQKALQILPNFNPAWNNLIFPLRATNRKSLSLDERPDWFLDEKGHKHFLIKKYILQYNLQRELKTKEIYYDEILSLLSNDNKLIIKNPKIQIYNPLKRNNLPKKVFALVNFGRSGTGLLHSLLDGHSELSILPSIYFSEFFNDSNWANITAGGWAEVTDRFIAAYEVLFNANVPDAVKTKGDQSIFKLGWKEGMASVGVNRDEVLSICKKTFGAELNELLNFREQLDAITFFKLVHFAYETT